MLPGAFSPLHILVVLTVALIVLGPKELPKIVRTMSRVMRELRALKARLDDEIESVLNIDDEPEPGQTREDPTQADQPKGGS